MTKARMTWTGMLLAGLAYLGFWPVQIEPVAWEAPRTAGYAGPFAPNTGLQRLKFIDLKGETGPEDTAVAPDGSLAVPVHSGKILRISLEDGSISELANPGGRVLGVEYSSAGELYAADAYRGLLKIGTDGSVSVLSNKTSDGSPIRYANDLDISRRGIIYFSDASTKFGAEAAGGTLPASLLDLMEHGPNGRVLKHDPQSGQTAAILDGRSFANGIALAPDDSYLLIAETGTYSVLKHWLTGPHAGKTETLLENLPGFPDNINGNPDGTFWLGLVSPRAPVLDLVAPYPFLRKMIMRLPAAIRPKPQRYGFAMRFSGNGDILEVLQDPDGHYALVTGGIDGPGGITFITSLTEPRLGYLPAR